MLVFLLVTYRNSVLGFEAETHLQHHTQYRYLVLGRNGYLTHFLSFNRIPIFSTR